MKQYQIKLLVPSGIVTEIYKDSTPLEMFEKEMINKYGTFVMLSSNEL
jgi:hypothetical protein